MAGHCAALVSGVNDVVEVFHSIPVRSSFVPIVLSATFNFTLVQLCNAFKILRIMILQGPCDHVLWRSATTVC